MSKHQFVNPHYGFPIPRHPFYHLHLDLETDSRQDITATAVRVDGNPSRDFWIHNDGTPSADGIFEAEKSSGIVIRVDWANDSSHKIEIDISEGKGKTTTLLSESTAPHWGGWWNSGWKYYSSHVVSENDGLVRSKEPVHLLLGIYAERLTSPSRELRVVAIDPLSGLPQEIPSQVYGITTQAKLKNEKAQPTTTLEVAFLADVAENSSKVYLVFYGNPKAPRPVYETDLTVSGEGLGVIIENSFYRIKLHDKCGQLEDILQKQGVNALWDHHVETNGALHWNPDVYAPPRIWSHASDWDPAPGYKTISGPIFFMTKRYGALPDYPDVKVAITYVFYAYQPYVMMDSVTDVSKDLDVRALRNGELVINLKVGREYAWKMPDGRIMVVPYEGRPKNPQRAIDIPADSEWWAFTNLDRHASLGAIILESSAQRRRGGLARQEPYITLKWGPFAYCTRPLAYTFNSHNPQRLIRVPATSSFSERIAFVTIRLGQNDEEMFDPIEDINWRLRSPLSVTGPDMEIDPRTPTEWGPTFPYPYM
jgi:hypothetical protein